MYGDYVYDGFDVSQGYTALVFRPVHISAASLAKLLAMDRIAPAIFYAFLYFFNFFICHGATSQTIWQPRR